MFYLNWFAIVSVPLNMAAPVWQGPRLLAAGSENRASMRGTDVLPELVCCFTAAGLQGPRSQSSCTCSFLI